MAYNTTLKPVGLTGAVPLVSDTGSMLWNKVSGVTDIFILEDDFMYENPGNGDCRAPWAVARNGGQIAQSNIAANTNIGIWSLDPENTNNNEVSISRGEGAQGGQCILGGGTHDILMYVQVPVLATAGNDFNIVCGLGSEMSVFDNPPGSDGVFFQYNRAASTNWIAGTKASGSITSSSGSLPAVTTGWTSLRFTINAAATLVTFYINGSLIGTSSTNIPTAAIGPGFYIKLTAGNSSRVFNVDYFRWYCKMTTPRF